MRVKSKNHAKLNNSILFLFRTGYPHTAIVRFNECVAAGAGQPIWLTEVSDFEPIRQNSMFLFVVLWWFKKFKIFFVQVCSKNKLLIMTDIFGLFYMYQHQVTSGKRYITRMMVYPIHTNA